MYLFLSPIFLKVESIVGIGYGSKFVSSLLRVLLKLATMQIRPFFCRARSEFDPLSGYALSFNVNVSF